MEQVPGEFERSKLTAAMASQRLLVLDFVRQYFTRWGGSPSHGEIGAALDIDRSRVRRAIRSLTRAGLLMRTPGPRGLALPDAEAEAIRQLRASGWIVDAPGRHAAKAALLPPAALDYPGDEQQGDRNGEPPNPRA